MGATSSAGSVGQSPTASAASAASCAMLMVGATARTGAGGAVGATAGTAWTADRCVGQDGSTTAAIRGATACVTACARDAALRVAPPSHTCATRVTPVTSTTASRISAISKPKTLAARPTASLYSFSSACRVPLLRALMVKVSSGSPWDLASLAPSCCTYRRRLSQQPTGRLDEALAKQSGVEPSRQVTPGDVVRAALLALLVEDMVVQENRVDDLAALATDEDGVPARELLDERVLPVLLAVHAVRRFTLAVRDVGQSVASLPDTEPLALLRPLVRVQGGVAVAAARARAAAAASTAALLRRHG